MRVDIGIDDSGLERTLMDLLNNLEDLSPAMRVIAAMGEAQIRESFADETDPAGNPWVQSLRARATNTKTLTDQGHLGDSASYTYGDDFAAWGVGMNYGAPHQFGFLGLPQRKFLPESFEEMHIDDVIDALREHLEL